MTCLKAALERKQQHPVLGSPTLPPSCLVLEAFRHRLRLVEHREVRTPHEQLVATALEAVTVVQLQLLRPGASKAL